MLLVNGVRNNISHALAISFGSEFSIMITHHESPRIHSCTELDIASGGAAVETLSFFKMENAKMVQADSALKYQCVRVIVTKVGHKQGCFPTLPSALQSHKF